MTLEDEIEFFGFIPEVFIKEMEDKIKKEYENDKEFLDSFVKSFPIFEEYVLQNCFTFPEKFLFERKITDKRIEISLQKILDEYAKIIDENKFIETENLRIKNEIEFYKYKIGQYKQILQIKRQYEELQEKNKELDNKICTIKNLYDDYMAINKENENSLLLLTENEKFKEIKQKKDKTEIESMIDFKNIDSILQNTFGK